VAVLGSQPRHGYQLKTAFEAATGGVWALNISRGAHHAGSASRSLAVDALVLRRGGSLRWLDLCEERLIAQAAPEPRRRTSR
jgi:hypothetical protein